MDQIFTNAQNKIRLIRWIRCHIGPKRAILQSTIFFSRLLSTVYCLPSFN